MHDSPNTLELEVFRSGDYGPKGVYTEAELDALARDYDAAEHEAPVTLDHAQSGPAHGWVSGLRRLGDRLLATVTRISPVLAAAIRTHAFRKRSIELYRQNARTRRPYLKAVTFLGAAAPEVKGLADPIFAADAPETVEFSESIESPERDFANEARFRLMEAGVWKPEWNDSGLLEVFRHLGATPYFETLIATIAACAPPVVFGRVGGENDAPVLAFSESLIGGASPESQRLHQQALDRLRANPAMSYRDALLSIQ